MTEEERIPLKEPIFKELQAEDSDVAPTEVESMCGNCGENVSPFTNCNLTEYLRFCQKF